MLVICFMFLGLHVWKHGSDVNCVDVLRVESHLESCDRQDGA